MNGPPVKPTRRRLSRRALLRRAAALIALPLACSAYAREVEPFWLDLHEIGLPIAGLPPAFDGFRVAHLTDLHMDDHVPLSYLRRVVQRVNDAQVDVVAVTGDVVNHTMKWVEAAGELLGSLRAPVVVSFGNHDYAPFTPPRAAQIIANPLHRRLAAAGCAVLRNQSAAITRGGARVWFVGLEDLWTDFFSPDDAFAGLPAGDVKVALSHNPDSARYLIRHGPKLILSGHTHGGQLRMPFVGAPLLPIDDRTHDQGLFRLDDDCQLYVSRGVGFLLRARFCCRPEVPIFVLRRAST